MELVRIMNMAILFIACASPLLAKSIGEETKVDNKVTALLLQAEKVDESITTLFKLGEEADVDLSQLKEYFISGFPITLDELEDMAAGAQATADKRSADGAMDTQGQKMRKRFLGLLTLGIGSALAVFNG